MSRNNRMKTIASKTGMKTTIEDKDKIRKKTRGILS